MSLPRYPKYKDSGVEWLGEVPEHWEVERLKRNAFLITEKAVEKTNPIALENVESWSARLIPTETDFEGDGVAFQRGDILFGKLRPYLAKAYWAESSGEAVGDFHVLRPSGQVQGRFLIYYLLNRDTIDIIDGSTFGAKMPRVSWEFLGNMLIPRAPAAEQARLIAFLDRETEKIDALVEEQRRLIELLKEKRQAVISHAVTKGLNPDAPMKDSGIESLGEVPAHWESMQLRRFVTSIEQGWSPQAEDREPECDEWGVLKLNAVKGGRFDGSKAKALFAEDKVPVGLAVQAGDFLLRACLRSLVLICHGHPGRHMPIPIPCGKAWEWKIENPIQAT